MASLKKKSNINHNRDRLPRWPNRRVIAYTPSIQNLSLVIRELLLRNSWELEGIVSTHEACIQAVEDKRANLIIFEGTSVHDVYDFLRLQMNHSLAMLTPTFLAVENLSEADERCIATIGEPVLGKTPISVTGIVGGLNELGRKWEKTYFLKLAAAFELTSSGKYRSALKILLDEFRKNPSCALVCMAISSHFRNQGNYQVAEKILIAGIQKSPRNMGIYATLIDFYMNSAAPSKALYFINKANQLFGNPSFLCEDAAQVSLITNKLREALPYLRQLQREEPNHITVRKILPRVCFAMGEIDEFDHLIRYRFERLESYQKAWRTLSQDQIDQKKELYRQITEQKKQTISNTKA